MFLAAEPCLFAEAGSAGAAGDEAAGTRQKLAVSALTTPKHSKRLSSFLMRNAQETYRPVFASRGEAIRLSMMAKMQVLILRADIMMREIT